MKAVPDHLAAWAAAIRAKGSLPVALSDGSGRDAALPEKVARRLVDLGLIRRDAEQEVWRLTVAGLQLTGGRP